MIRIGKILLASLLLVNWHLTFSQDFDSGKIHFAIKIKGETINYRLFSIFLDRGEQVICQVHPDTLTIEAESDDVSILKMRKGNWKLTAPNKTGLYSLELRSPNGSETMILNCFVKEPMSNLNHGILNGYRIGDYPTVPFKGNPRYKRPSGFIEVTESNLFTWLSPHFQLHQFLCKQESGFPKYMIITLKLLLKLEFILEEINKKGYPASTLFIMSGYRTPSYNHAIGNVKYSRHIYGDAADIFIDEDKNQRMDDINGDGIIDRKDIGLIYEIINGLSDKESYKPYIGGLGKYKKTTVHSGFVHIDARGKKARW